MSNPIFARLEDMLNLPSTSMLWCVSDQRHAGRENGSDATPRFGVAEQALNTIYLLGEKPDGLAGDIIKALTRRIFESVETDDVVQDLAQLAIEDQHPDSTEQGSGEGGGEEQASPPASAAQLMARAPTAGSFELGQLVFVVGHVAMKHIVYLELVERELKRRKESATKGPHSFLSSP